MVYQSPTGSVPKQRELSTPPDGVLWVWYSLPIRAVSHGGIKRVHRCVLYSELLDINIVNWRYQCTVLFVDVQRAAAVSVCLSVSSASRTDLRA